MAESEHRFRKALNQERLRRGRLLLAQHLKQSADHFIGLQILQFLDPDHEHVQRKYWFSKHGLSPHELKILIREAIAPELKQIWLELIDQLDSASSIDTLWDEYVRMRDRQMLDLVALGLERLQQMDRSKLVELKAIARAHSLQELGANLATLSKLMASVFSESEREQERKK